ncbi:hypothetical protein, partial [Pseudomonas sp. YQ_4]|uniref:hypothetical protein n=1 Tax=Pseudomonas sp. YQ_4 TaxID=3367228 RepID=UPI00370ADDA0
RSGFTREEAGPAGQYLPAFPITATTAFAGKPAPTLAVMVTYRWLYAARCRSGFTREEAGPADQYLPAFPVTATTAFAGKPAPTLGAQPFKPAQ